jgi:TolB protein
MDANGENRRHLEGTNGSGPLAWSPDGTQIAYRGYMPDFRGEVFVVDVDGGEPRNLSNHEFDDGTWLAWSLDGARIAFTSTREPDGIYAVTLDGTTEYLSEGLDIVEEPAWSPDGMSLVCRVQLDEQWDVYLIPLNGGDPINLTNDPAYDGGAVWSPDGSRLAFLSTRIDDNARIFVMDADGGNLHTLEDWPPDDPAYDVGNDAIPMWSPDGSSIVFASTRAGRGGIYVADSDGVRLLVEAPRAYPYGWHPTSQ